MYPFYLVVILLRVRKFEAGSDCNAALHPRQLCSFHVDASHAHLEEGRLTGHLAWGCILVWGCVLVWTLYSRQVFCLRFVGKIGNEGNDLLKMKWRIEFTHDAGRLIKDDCALQIGMVAMRVRRHSTVWEDG
ncbi:hypothetical protein L6452_33414 [Arctium lappa]|uniref:Uncharacterized protein n=1 Tax=Arctium lappa TaxID=4217 RepID=A0ACB8YEM1_ARCLA|nr:hypothetical protein L6452_33414 [Arctium lappa]